MKDLYYYDSRHDNTIVVKNPKSRKDAINRIWKKYVPELFDDTAFEDKNYMTDIIYEIGDVVVL
jgi:predicted metallopeptidase